MACYLPSKWGASKGPPARHPWSQWQEIQLPQEAKEGVVSSPKKLPGELLLQSARSPNRLCGPLTGSREGAEFSRGSGPESRVQPLHTAPAAILIEVGVQ